VPRGEDIPLERGHQRGVPPLEIVILPLLAHLAWKRLQIYTDLLLIITSDSGRGSAPAGEANPQTPESAASPIPDPTRRLWRVDARAFGASIVVPPDTKSWRRHWSPPLFKVKLRLCDHGRRAGTKPVRTATNSSFNTPSSTSWCRTNHFFHGNLSLKCLEKCLNWLKQTVIRDTAAQNCCWLMLLSFD